MIDVPLLQKVLLSHDSTGKDVLNCASTYKSLVTFRAFPPSPLTAPLTPDLLKVDEVVDEISLMLKIILI